MHADVGMLHETSGRYGFCPVHAAEDVEDEEEDERVPLEILLPSGAKLSLCCSWDTTLDKLLEAVQSLDNV